MKHEESLPLYYAHQKKAWMNSEIIKIWFQSECVSTVGKHLKDNKLSRKALQVLENPPLHLSIHELAKGDN